MYCELRPGFTSRYLLTGSHSPLSRSNAYARRSLHPSTYNLMVNPENKQLGLLTVAIFPIGCFLFLGEVGYLVSLNNNVIQFYQEKLTLAKHFS